MKKTTQKDIADYLHLSTATVLDALRTKPRTVSEKTKKLVRKTAKSFNYRKYKVTEPVTMMCFTVPFTTAQDFRQYCHIRSLSQSKVVSDLVSSFISRAKQ